MDGKVVSGRPLVVRLASEKQLGDAADKTARVAKKLDTACSTTVQLNRNAKIAAIKNKLKALEGEDCGIKKKPRLQTASPRRAPLY